jgi:hypothetical protein
MRRFEAESLLRDRSLEVRDRSYGDNTEAIVPLGREPSRHWYCSWEQVQALIDFDPVHPRLIGSANDPNDKVKAVRLDHWLQDCL